MQNSMIFASVLMFLIVTLLVVLVPGGPIENRDFHGLKGVVFWGFNVFLITLGIMSYITSYLLLIANSNAIALSKVIAVLYFILSIVDLAGIFPKSPTKMSKTLMLMELIISSLAVFLFIYVTAIGMGA